MRNPLSRIPRKRLWTGGFVVVGVLLVGYVAWLGLRISNHLQDARDAIHALEVASEQHDPAATQKQLDRISSDAHSAASASDSLVWRALAALPLVGSNANVPRVLSHALANVSDSALWPAMLKEQELSPRLAPHNGRVDLAAVAQIRPIISAALPSVRAAANQVDSVSTTGLLPPIGGKLDGVRRDLDHAVSALGAADQAAGLMHSMLGADGPRRYLVLFENNAEIRSTGGMPGAWAVIAADKGALSVVQQGSDADFPQWPSPITSQSATEKAIYDTQPVTYFQDLNFTPDFPRTAQLAEISWAKRYGTHLDGVMAIDTVSVSYMLRATGPVHLPDGTVLTSDNATKILLNTSYIKHPNLGHKLYFQMAAGVLFQHLFTHVQKPMMFLGALYQSATEGRLHIASSHPDEQAQLAPTEVGGTLITASTPNPQLGVYLNDTTGSKMSYFLSTKTDVRATYCHGGKQTLAGQITLSARKPEPSELNPYITGNGANVVQGDQLVTVRVYGPVGGTFSRVTLAGQPLPPDQSATIDDRGRPVLTLYVELSGGQSTPATFEVTTGPGQTGATQVSQTPGLIPTPGHWIVASAC